MTLILELPPEVGIRLEKEAARRGMNQTDMARRLIEESLSRVPTGAEAIAFWKKEGALGTFTDRPEDSTDLARQLRQEAETRDWSEA